MAVSASASSQQSKADLAELRSRIEKDLREAPAPLTMAWPGQAISVPSAFGGKYGVVGFGFGLQNRVRFRTGKADGVFGAIVPVGDPVNAIGLDIALSIYDVSDFGNRGSADFMVHKRFGDSALAAGYERAVPWGISDSDRSVYVVGSHLVRLRPLRSEPFSRLNVSLGVGNGRFQREQDAIAEKNGLNVFGSASINIHPQANVFAEWTGQDINLGTSIVPLKGIPLNVTAALADVTGSAGDGIRFLLGIGYTVRFK